MAVVVEIINRNRRVAFRYLLDKDEVSLGRAFDNDVVLDDIHVDAHHAVLRVNEDNSFDLIDRNSRNGLRNKKRKRIGRNVHFNNRCDFFFGDTRVRFSDPTMEVKPAVSMRQDKLIPRLVNNIFVAFAVLMLVNFRALYQTYVSSAVEVEVVKYIQAVSQFSLALLAIAMIASFISKVSRREWKFAYNLMVFSLFVLIAESGDFIIQVVKFNYNLVKISWLIDSLWLTVLIIALMWALTKSAIYLKPFLQRLLIGSMGVVVFGLISVQTVYSTEPRFLRAPPLTNLYRPDGYRWRENQSDETFIDQAQFIFDIEIEGSKD